MKKTLLMATGALLAAGFATTDAKAFDVELYGQVNKTIMAADNGSKTDVSIGDNEKSATRMGVKGKQMLDNGLTASVLIEYEMNTDSTENDLFALDANRQTSLIERHARVGLGGDFGTVLIGHTSVATDGVYEIDMAGVDDLLGSDIRDFGGKTTLGGTTDTISNAFIGFDAARGDVVAYHSPTVNGANLQVTVAEGGDLHGAVRYAGKVAGLSVKAGAGYELYNEPASPSTTEVDSRFTGSFSVKDEDLGVAFSYAYGKNFSDAGPEASRHYAKLGKSFDALELAVDYSIQDSDATKADNADAVEGTSYGIGAQYNLGHGVSVAAAFRNLSFDNTVTNIDDINLTMANLRVKF